MNILITSADYWKSALTCMRSMAKKGHRISLISSGKYIPGFYSRFCHERIVSPPEPDKEKYVEFILQLVKSKNYDLIVPISDLCIEYFSEIRSSLTKFVKISLPSEEAIAIARNKTKTYIFARENGIPVPRTCLPKNLAEAETFVDTVGLPCVAKKSSESSGKGNRYIHAREELTALFRENGQWQVLQEFIYGSEHGFAAVCDSGKVLSYFMFKIIRSYPETGGITVYAKSYLDEDLLDLASLIVEKLSWTGAIDIDFFKTTAGKFVMLEINPRFSGTTHFAYLCGVDLPQKYLELSTSSMPQPDTETYIAGRYYRAIFPAEIDSCLENKKNIAAFILNFLNPNMRNDIQLDDMNLLLWQVKSTKWEIDKRSSKIRSGEYKKYEQELKK